MVYVNSFGQRNELLGQFVTAIWLRISLVLEIGPPASLCKFWVSLGSIELGMKRILKEEATSLGKIYNRLGTPSACALSYARDDFCEPGYTCLGSG